MYSQRNSIAANSADFLLAKQTVFVRSLMKRVYTSIRQPLENGKNRILQVAYALHRVLLSPLQLFLPF